MKTKRLIIVKTSSLGDIIQSFDVLNYLHKRYPEALIDWVVEARFASIVAAHPLVHRVIAFDIKNFKQNGRMRQFWQSLLKSLRFMREVRYDALFDLQGNCKSGAITFLCRAKTKIGFGKKSVREWPNILATNLRFDIPRSMNIRLQYVQLVQKWNKDTSSVDLQGVRFKLDPLETQQLQEILQSASLFQKKIKVMICPGSKWANKQLPVETLLLFLDKMEQALQCSFLLIWGADEEKEICQNIHRHFSQCSMVVDRLTLPLWQNLMNEVDLVMAVDSGALHLCGTTSTPSFSIFGPTRYEVFKPLGPHHLAYQGQCPQNVQFQKQCPILRSCATAACIRDIDADRLFTFFWNWWSGLSYRLHSRT